jgi:hypothetical protein
MQHRRKGLFPEVGDRAEIIPTLDRILYTHQYLGKVGLVLENYMDVFQVEFPGGESNWFRKSELLKVRAGASSKSG